MTSFKQIETNRANARHSTGPVTQQGKQRSRCNAVRHGLTAETVIGALEDAEDYHAFEAAIIADYDVQSAVERELVLRLASLLWRLRRATAVETGLFQVQAGGPAEPADRLRPETRQIVCEMAPIADTVGPQRGAALSAMINDTPALSRFGPEWIGSRVPRTIALARCFWRLADLPNAALDRLSRYEAALWRQVGQVLFALDSLDRRKPQERRRQRD